VFKRPHFPLGSWFVGGGHLLPALIFFFFGGSVVNATTRAGKFRSIFSAFIYFVVIAGGDGRRRRVGLSDIRGQFRILQVLGWWSCWISWRVGIGDHGRRVFGGDRRGQIAGGALFPSDGVRGGAGFQDLLSRRQEQDRARRGGGGS